MVERLPPTINAKGIKSFLGHAIFYRRFIKYFSKITRPFSNLLNKDAPFVFNEKCGIAFNLLKEKLMTTLVIVAPNWSQDFELMCDASDYMVGAVMGQKRDKVFHAIYYARKILNETQVNYSTTE